MPENAIEMVKRARMHAVKMMDRYVLCEHTHPDYPRLMRHSRRANAKYWARWSAINGSLFRVVR